LPLLLPLLSLLPLLLFYLNQPKSLGAPSSARLYAPKVGMYILSQPALAVVLALAVAFLLSSRRDLLLSWLLLGFLYPNANTVISTEAAHAFVSSAAEKPASLAP